VPEWALVSARAPAAVAVEAEVAVAVVVVVVEAEVEVVVVVVAEAAEAEAAEAAVVAEAVVVEAVAGAKSRRQGLAAPLSIRSVGDIPGSDSGEPRRLDPGQPSILRAGQAVGG
jgi:hypothetical protein